MAVGDGHWAGRPTAILCLRLLLLDVLTSQAAASTSPSGSFPLVCLDLGSGGTGGGGGGVVAVKI